MLLYVGLSFLVFIVFLLGLGPGAVKAAECWPNQPEDPIARADKRIVTALTFAVFLILWFLTAWRSSAIGNDTKNYLYYFDIFSNGLDRTRSFELGYQYLNYAISKITRSHHHFLIIIATIMYGGTAFYIFRYSRNPAVSLCLFFCYFFSPFTSIFRQGIAMMIVLYGYQFLKDGKRILAAVVFLLATAFHTTALVSFLLFFDFNLLKRRWLVLGLTAFCAVISGTGLLRLIVDAIVPRYSHYFESRYASSGWTAITYTLIIYVVWYFLIVGSVDGRDRKDRITVTNFTMLILFAAFGYSVNLFARAGEYFLLIGVTEIPNVLCRERANRYRLVLFALCVGLLLLFLVTRWLRPGWNHLYPYEFWN